MKTLFTVLKYLIALVVVLVAVAFLLPREVSVTRSIQINGPAATIFAYANSTQEMQKWSPWASIDPDMVMTFSGPETGVGNHLAWTSNDPKVGNGQQTITESVDGAKVVSKLDFGDMGTAIATLSLTGSGDTTDVTWSFITDLGMNPIGRWMGLMMDKWVGADYEKGLVSLKGLVEGE